MTTHVTSLEISKQLKAAGYPQESEYHWKLQGKEFELVTLYYLFDRNLHGDSRVYAAPLLSELLEKLPPDRLFRTPNEAANCWLDLHSGNQP